MCSFSSLSRLSKCHSVAEVRNMFILPSSSLSIQSLNSLSLQCIHLSSFSLHYYSHHFLLGLLHSSQIYTARVSFLKRKSDHLTLCSVVCDSDSLQFHHFCSLLTRIPQWFQYLSLVVTSPQSFVNGQLIMHFSGSGCFLFLKTHRPLYLRTLSLSSCLFYLRRNNFPDLLLIHWFSRCDP